MRKFVLAALMLGAAHSAHAADLPDFSPVLRGAFPEGLSRTAVVWQGYYVGGQAGYGSSDENFYGATDSIVARLLANTTIQNEFQISQWPLLGKTSARNSAFGAFGGYNSQWDDVVVGVDVSYMHGKFGGSSTGTMTRVFATSDGNLNNVTSTATASIAGTDYATFRARAGYAVNGFLPYIFGGFALGQADITRQVSINASGFPLSATETQHGHLLYGYAAGAGVDVNLIGGLFLRAEYEYIRFTSQVDTSINTVRAGVGYKF